MLDISSKKLFLLDLDGVLLRGKERPIKIGGTKLIERIRKKGKKLFVLTNDSTDSRQELRSRLASMDIVVDEKEVLTATRVTAEYILKNYGKVKYRLVGEDGFARELDGLGHVRTTGLHADVLAVGLDRRLTYRKLDDAVTTAKNGARIVATNSSRQFMYKYGPAVGVGPILKAIEYGSGKSGVTVGKPSPHMFVTALETAGCKPSEALMVGDQEDTDILGSARVGIDSVLVGTGLHGADKKSKASMRLGNVDELADLI